ncbi:MAG TPA: DUF1287 domain-containing protein [Sphingomicrobium sp.]
MLDRRTLLVGAGASVALAGCSFREASRQDAPRLQATRRAEGLIAAAREQIGVTVRYDGSYARIPFPDGDVPRSRGACTDVLVRAYRDAFGVDLQALVNEDMRAAFAAYPRIWGLSEPDPSIDHRRVPNLATWLARRHARLPVPASPDEWRPGDIFTSRPAGPHIGIVSDRAGRRSPLIIHNIGAGAREEDALLDWPITGRFRWRVG